MLVLSKHFFGDALAVLKAMSPDEEMREIPDARGFYVCRGEKTPEGYAFLEHIDDGDQKGVLCQKK